jgi:hypothetical protein
MCYHVFDIRECFLVENRCVVSCDDYGLVSTKARAIPWEFNVSLAKGHTRYGELVRGTHVDKCVTTNHQSYRVNLHRINNFNTLRAGDAVLRFYVTTVQDE